MSNMWQSMVATKDEQLNCYVLWANKPGYVRNASLNLKGAAMQHCGCQLPKNPIEEEEMKLCQLPKMPKKKNN